MSFSKEQRKTPSFLNSSGTSVPVSWGLLWRFGCLILLCWQKNERSSEQTLCHPTLPQEWHLGFCCSLLQGCNFFSPLLSLPFQCKLMPAPRLFSTCCSRTAQPWEKYILHTRQFPALQGQLRGHRDTVVCPHKAWNTRFSLPCHYTLHVGLHGLRRAREVACAASPHRVTLSTLFPRKRRKCPGSINTEPSKPLLNPPADVLWTQTQASPPAREDQECEDVSEGNANPRAGKAHLTQLLLFRVVLNVPSSGCLQRYQHVHTGEAPHPGLASHGVCVASGWWSPAACTQPIELSSQCCKTVICPGRRDLPSRNGRTCEAVPQPVSVGITYGMGCHRLEAQHFIPVQCHCVPVRAPLMRSCLGWSFPSGWQSRKTPRLKDDNAGSTLQSPVLLGAKTLRSADILIGPAVAVLDAVPAQPPGDAGAVLVDHRAAAPPLRPARGAGSRWEGWKTGNRNASAALIPSFLFYVG